MRTLASTARRFSYFPAAAIAAADGEVLRSAHARLRDAMDHVSYFETLMRLRCRRPAPRRAARRY
jgi:hypothetical protein